MGPSKPTEDYHATHARARTNPVASAIHDVQPKGRKGDQAINLAAAILLYRLRYWMPRAKLKPKSQAPDDPRVWVIKSHREWAEETGLSETQCQRAMKVLKRLGLVECGQHKFGGRTILFTRLKGGPSLRVVKGGRTKSSDPGFDDIEQPVPDGSARLRNPGSTNSSNPSHRGTRHKATKRTKRAGLASGSPENSFQNSFRGENRRERTNQIAERFEAEEETTEEDVWRKAEGAEASGSMRALLDVWCAAQRVSRGSAFVPSLPNRGKAAGHVKTLRKALPEGTVAHVIALLGLRWASFRRHLERDCGWDREKLSRSPSLTLAASRPEAVAAWVRSEFKDNRGESVGPTPNEIWETLE